MNQTLLIPDALFPIDTPPLFNNPALLIENGLIRALGPYSQLRPQFPHATELRLPHHALLPGLINAHCHLELTYMRNLLPPPTHFTSWVSDLIRHYPAPEQLQSTITASLHAGLTESLRSGVTTLGDITRHPALTRVIIAEWTDGEENLVPRVDPRVPRVGTTSVPPRAASEPLNPAATALLPRILSYGEITALGTTRHHLPQRLESAATPFPTKNQELTTKNLVGLSPHAPYTIEAPALRAIAARAIADRLPLAMHLAELPEEAAFLRDLSGPLGRDLLLKMNILDNLIPLHPGGPIRWALDNGLADASAAGLPILLAHVNYATDQELALLATHHLSVAYCPRTHHYFAHAPHRYREMLAKGINVALGTDSLASNPDLNLLKEAQFLFQRDHTDSLTLLKMLTLHGARALGLQSQIGSLTPGKSADLIALPYPPTTPQNQIAPTLLTTAPLPTHLWLHGQQL